MFSETYLWLVFIGIFLVLMVIDLGLFNRGEKHIGMKKALRLVALYITVAVLFGLLIAYELGFDLAAAYYAAYTVEMSMSIDNLFVFIIIFSMFAIPDEDQHRVLFWGILGAICFRALFIFAGAELLDNFHFVMYIFGVILIYTAYKTAFAKKDENKDPKSTFAVKLARHVRATPELHGGRFVVKIDGKHLATPLLTCLLVIELSDIMFAFDSIPAALAISTDIFIVYSSNIFAVMGLRSMYFVIKDALASLCYLKYGLGVILAFIGAKMLFSDFIEVGVVTSLVVILAVLAVTVIASYTAGKKKGKKPKNEAE
ncbi:MAG: TerC/Alx family metal homeostasis membrane protein [Candidatus Methanomethylophilus sp.]|nr:TerC/Alx family metal homeostasis membrane protein [Methanomethylophilus sp.]MDD4222370.1 TerC/Alx family metal homeostasis membrane protein [Methanomethylophilus sp.]MDD4669309.1 TerC/Alx family metal homeostasis membrane protein [Methanomethylophilus sp.]